MANNNGYQEAEAQKLSERLTADQIATIQAFAKKNAYRTSRNAVYQHLRHILLVNEYGEKQQENLSRQQNEGAGNIEENMFAEELLLLIQHTVEQMPAQRKRIYEMSRKEGKNNDEIAQLLVINKRTVENHLTQALADIRKMLKHFYLF